MSTIKINLQGLNNLKKDISPWLDKISKKVADHAPNEIIDNVLAGKTGIFPGSNLPQNKGSTIAKKGHGEQLVDTGTLLTGRLWTTRKTAGGYSVVPPPLRRTVTKHLSEKTQHRPAYKIMDIPRGFVPLWLKTMVNTAFSKFIKKYQ